MKHLNKYKSLLFLFSLALVIFPKNAFSQSGNVLDFDGVNDHIRITPLATPSQFTIEWWHYGTNRINWNQRIASFNDWNGFTFHTDATGAIYVGTTTGTRFEPADIGSGTFVLNTWQHFAYTFNSGEARFYKNGIQLASKSDMATPTAWIGMRIGYTDDRTIRGRIDEFRFWNVARTQTEIQTDMNSYITDAHAQWNNLITYYRFDQGDAGSGNGGLPNEVIDYTANCNTGSLNGFSLGGTTSNWVSASNDAAPILTSTTVSNVFVTSANIDLEIFSTGIDVTVSDIGLVWSTSICPTIADNSTTVPGSYGTGTHTVSLSGLSGNTTYYVRAFAQNTDGLSYGETLSFTTNSTMLPPLGNALNFDRTSPEDHILVQNNASLQPAVITIEAWAYRTDIVNLMPIVSKPIGTGNGNSYQLGFKWQNIVFRVGDPGTWDGALENSVDATTLVPANEWHHIAGTWDGTNNRIYVDGILVSTLTPPATTITYDTRNILIGADDDTNDDDPDQALGGMIDEVRIWNVVRTQTEIQGNMYTQYSPGDDANLVGNWRFDQGRDAIDNTDLPNEVIDYSLNCNTGTLNNFALTGGTGNWVSTTNDGAPVLTTSSIYNISSSSADVDLEIFNPGASTNGGYGICWSLSSCPTISDNSVSVSTTISNSVLTESISCLYSNTTYYARAFAWNLSGLTYGETRSFTTLASTPNENIWIGCVSNDWFNPANWSENATPVSTDNLIIPGNTPFQPWILLSSPVYNPGNLDAECGTITINVDEGAKVTIEAGRFLNTN